MKARKENKVYRITEDQKTRYLNEGYDLYDDEGNLTQYSPQKKILLSEHERLIQELKTEMEGKIAELEAAAEKRAEKKAGE